MCGIYCSISKTCHIRPDPEIEQRLHKRGPDSTGTVHVVYPEGLANDEEHSSHVTLNSTVLSLRGWQTVSQPFQDLDANYTLCWNGEAWSIGDQPATGNDTQIVYELLAQALNSDHPQT